MKTIDVACVAMIIMEIRFVDKTSPGTLESLLVLLHNTPSFHCYSGLIPICTLWSLCIFKCKMSR